MERIPILKLGDCLIISLQVDLHDRLALAMQDDLANRVVKTGARGVLIDISGLDMVDSFIGRILGNIASLCRVLDAETVIVGMQPAVAITLVELGVTWDNVRTALNVERGMALLRLQLDTPSDSSQADPEETRDDDNAGAIARV